jgi:signal peptidase
MKYYSKRELKEKLNRRAKIRNIIKKIIFPILVVIILLNIYIIFQKVTHPNQVVDIFGYQLYVVSSGSMEPTLHVGDVIFVDKDFSVDELQEGDIITFRGDQKMDVTHRILKVNDEEETKTFITKGDNNNSPDVNKLKPSNIQGKYAGKVTGFGVFFLSLKTSIGVVLVAIVIIAIYYFLGKRDDKIFDRHMKRTETQRGIYLNKYKYNQDLDNDEEPEEEEVDIGHQPKVKKKVNKIEEDEEE